LRLPAAYTKLDPNFRSRVNLAPRAQTAANDKPSQPGGQASPGERHADTHTRDADECWEWRNCALGKNQRTEPDECHQRCEQVASMKQYHN
jgi:hypothetical protein